MRKIQTLVSLLFIFGFILSAYAQVDSSSLPQPKENVKAESKPLSFIEWAWDSSYDVMEQYPITAYSYWRPPQTPLILNFFTDYERDWNKVEALAFTEIALFHPVVVNLSREVTVAMGAYVRGVQNFREGWEGDIESPLPIMSPTDSNVYSIAAGFSMMWSFPVPGIQMHLAVGYMEARAKSETNVLFPSMVIFPPGPPGPPIVIPSTIAEVQTIQQEAGLDTSFRFTWHSEKRNFLSGMDLQIINYHQTTAHARRKTHHPLVDIPTEDGIDTSDSSFITANLWAKVLATELHRVPHFLHPQYLRRHLLSFELGGKVGHVAAIHGHNLAAGARINYADTIFFAYYHNWEQKNQQKDSDSLMLELLVAL